jgi:hypothetical protein
MNHELVAFGKNFNYQDIEIFKKKHFFLRFISCNLLSLNENIRLPINDVSSNIDNFTCAYFFIKTSRLSLSSGLKSWIDLFNGMDNATVNSL